MPRRKHHGSAGLIFHVFNRGARRLRVFRTDGDYDAFLRTIREAHHRVPIRILSYCLMPTHFHFVLWPSTDDQLREFMWWLTGTHSKRWHGFHQTIGTGPIYQGRYKAVPVQGDRHFLRLCRYVEANPVKARFVRRAEEWPWSSLAQRCRNLNVVPLETWPILQPVDWVQQVNSSIAQEVDIEESLRSGVPLGDAEWSQKTASVLGLPASRRSAGRPKKNETTPGGVSG